MADDFELALIPVAFGPKLWVAIAHFEEDDHDENAAELASEVVRDLILNELLPKKQKPAKRH